MLCQQANPRLFFLLQPCRRQPTLPKAVWRKPLSLLPLLPVKQWYRLRQLCSFAILLFFLIDEIQSRQRKWKPWALKTVAAAASSFIL
jgi:hypothetical protein